MLISPKRILWPTDFSALSMHGGHYARGFRDVFDAELHIVHVIEAQLPKEMTVTLAEKLPITPPEPEERQAADDGLKRLVDEEFGGADNIKCVTLFGRPWARVCKYANENEIDLIIVSTHGHTGLRHVLIGSTAERIVQHAPCPVLTVKDPEREFLIE
ncbi:MAG: universal stress protein [Phycisphaerae bacterium]|nr:universal stress protein [Phycisphaerae bacterium]